MANVEFAVVDVNPNVELLSKGGRPFLVVVPSSGSSTVLDLLAGDQGRD